MSGGSNLTDKPLPRWGVVLWIAALVLLLAGLVAARYIPGEGFTALIQFDETFTDRALPAIRATPHHVRPTGYDGQFYAQLALDPFLGDPEALHTAIDATAYRARRILLPALAAFLGGGASDPASTARTLDVYALLNPLFWLGLVALLLRACRPLSLTAMLSLTAVALAGGVVESIRLALTDLPATTLLLAALLLAARPAPLAPLWAGCVGALAGLARDTAAAAAGLLLLPVGEWFAAPRDRRFPLLLRWSVALLLAAVPVLAWAAYVAHVFPGIIGQGSGAPDNFDLPLTSAWARLVAAGAQLRAGAPLWGQEGFALWAVVGLHAQAVYLLWKPRPREALWRMGLPFALLIWILGPAVWSSYLAAARALLPMTVAFNLLLLPELRTAGRDGKPWAWFALGNFFSLFGIIKFWTYVS